MAEISELSSMSEKGTTAVCFKEDKEAGSLSAKAGEFFIFSIEGIVKELDGCRADRSVSTSRPEL